MKQKKEGLNSFFFSKEINTLDGFAVPQPKIVIGTIVRNFDRSDFIIRFLENAKKYGHSIYRIIVAYSHDFYEEEAKKLVEKAEVSFIKLNHNTISNKWLSELGISEEVQKILLYCDLLQEHNLVPYGFNRNTVLLEAIRIDADILIYVDSDVFPEVLFDDKKKKEIIRKEVDFIGEHVKWLNRGADVTSSEYSGFNILPVAYFPKMNNLLEFMQKEEMKGFWCNSRKNHSLLLQKNMNLFPVRTKKILGGNLGIRLASFVKMPPFFSYFYLCGGKTYLCRGEDTLWGLNFSKYKINCVDIDLHILHDTYGNYPKIPYLKSDTAVQKRFFYACAGWIGRNVFMNRLTKTPGKPRDLLKSGTEELYRYTGNSKFLQLPDMLNSAEKMLPDMICNYEKTVMAWENLKGKVLRP